MRGVIAPHDFVSWHHGKLFDCLGLHHVATNTAACVENHKAVASLRERIAEQHKLYAVIDAVAVPEIAERNRERIRGDGGHIDRFHNRATQDRRRIANGQQVNPERRASRSDQLAHGADRGAVKQPRSISAVGSGDRVEQVNQPIHLKNRGITVDDTANVGMDHEATRLADAGSIDKCGAFLFAEVFGKRLVDDCGNVLNRIFQRLNRNRHGCFHPENRNLDFAEHRVQFAFRLNLAFPRSVRQPKADSHFHRGATGHADTRSGANGRELRQERQQFGRDFGRNEIAGSGVIARRHRFDFGRGQFAATRAGVAFKRCLGRFGLDLFVIVRRVSVCRRGD